MSGVENTCSRPAGCWRVQGFPNSTPVPLSQQQATPSSTVSLVTRETVPTASLQSRCQELARHEGRQLTPKGP